MKKTIWLIVLLMLISISGCKKKGGEVTQPEEKTYKVTFMDGDTILEEKEVKEGSVSEVDAPEKSGYVFLYWEKDGASFNFSQEIKEDIILNAKYSYEPFSLKGLDEISDGTSIRINLNYLSSDYKPSVTWSLEASFDAMIETTNPNYVRITTNGVGKMTVTATSSDYFASKEVTVVGASYTLDYDVDEEDEALLDGVAIYDYNTANFPLTLPVLEKEDYIFKGWRVDGYDEIFTTFTHENEMKGDFTLSPEWIFPYLDVSYIDGVSALDIGEEKALKVIPCDIPDELIPTQFNFASLNTDIATVSSSGVVKGEASGYTEIKVELKSTPSINMTIGVSVIEGYAGLSDLAKYLTQIVETNALAKTINVVCWQYQYKYDMLGSLLPYLFEDLSITENLAPLSNANRPGTIKQKYYICVHDTADAEYSAYEWSMTVYKNFNEQTGNTYNASYQYVVGNDGIYHNIPDNEVAWHAGDGTSVSYELLPSGVYGENKHPEITITTDGYFAIDGTKSSILAPKNGNTILQTKDINDCSIRCILQDGQYYLGRTYYNSTYRKISNFAGNNNSIGIESCVNYGSDVFLTWQRLAKLVAYLMDTNNLTIDDVKPHHFFSGKNCPETMRDNGLYNYFLGLVEVEYNILQYTKLGYKLELVSYDSEYANEVGRIIRWDKRSHNVSFEVKVTYNGTSEIIPLSIIIPGKSIK